jgi:hypothetical protein
MIMSILLWRKVRTRRNQDNFLKLQCSFTVKIVVSFIYYGTVPRKYTVVRLKKFLLSWGKYHFQENNEDLFFYSIVTANNGKYDLNKKKKKYLILHICCYKKNLFKEVKKVGAITYNRWFVFHEEKISYIK